MRAIVYEKYGPPDVLELREIDRPTIKDNEVLVRVHAAAIGAGDLHLLTGEIWAVRLYQGLCGPKRKVLGHDLAGTVEAVESPAPVTEVLSQTPTAGTHVPQGTAVHLTVSLVSPPVAMDDAAATTEGKAVAIDVLANDMDDSLIDATTVSVVTPPSDGATAVEPMTGIITYTPDPGFNATDGFTYTVADDQGETSNEATVTVTVNGS